MSFIFTFHDISSSVIIVHTTLKVSKVEINFRNETTQNMKIERDKMCENTQFG